MLTYRPSESGDESHPSKQRKKQNDAKTATLKAQLKKLLSQPLLSRGVSTRYITSGNRPIADDIISGDGRSSAWKYFPGSDYRV
jgi:ATP-dependent RNA helicase DDX24/MAK5